MLTVSLIVKYPFFFYQLPKVKGNVRPPWASIWCNFYGWKDIINTIWSPHKNRLWRRPEGRQSGAQVEHQAQPQQICSSTPAYRPATNQHWTQTFFQFSEPVHCSKCPREEYPYHRYCQRHPNPVGIEMRSGRGLLSRFLGEYTIRVGFCQQFAHCAKNISI